MTWFITNNDYIQKYLLKFVDKYNNKVTNILFDILSCHKCTSFWFTLLITFNIWFALCVSFVAHLLQKENTL